MRVQVVASVVQVVKLLETAVFDAKLKNLLVEYFKDPVNYVRRVAAAAFVQIARLYGEIWAKKNLIGQAIEMSK